MKKNKFTHYGYVVGVDARVPRDYIRKIKLRQTKMFWVDKAGCKFRKRSLYVPGEWPLYKLRGEPVMLEDENSPD